MNQNNRADESERVLFAVLGMSPAVLTETVWALARETPPVIPHRVVVSARGLEAGTFEYRARNASESEQLDHAALLARLGAG